MARVAQRAELHFRCLYGYMMSANVLKVISVILSALLLGCGSHEQSLWRVDVNDPAKSVTETDPLKIVIAAIYSGDIEKIKLSINQGVDVNSRNEEGLTLLMVSVKAQQFAVIDYLLQAGADIEVKSNVASFNPQLSVTEFVEKLQSDSSTKMPADIHTVVLGLLNKQDFPASVLGTFIHSGIEDKNLQLVRWVLSKGGDPNALFMTGDNKDKPKYSPLIHVFSLEGVEDFSVEGKSVPHFSNLRKIFDLLAEHPKIDLNLKVRRYTPLKRAIRRAEKEPKYQPWLDRLRALGAQ